MTKRTKIITFLMAVMMLFTAIAPGFAQNVQLSPSEAEAATLRLSDNTDPYNCKKDLIIVTGSAVNLRSAPNTTTSKVYYQLRKGSSLEYRGYSGNYWKVYDGCTGRTGYISKSYTIRDTVSRGNGGNKYMWLYITGSNVNIRTTPRTGTSNTAYTLQKGALVRVTSSTIWYNYGYYWAMVPGGYLAFAEKEVGYVYNHERAPVLCSWVYDIYKWDCTHDLNDRSSYIASRVRYWN